MESIWPILALAVVVFVVGAIMKALSGPSRRKTSDASPQYPYQSRGALFTSAERSFLGVLDRAVDGRARVFGKARVSDVITTRKGMSAGNRQRAFNKISSKHFDFLLCRNDDLSPICAIELDDKSHQKQARLERDAFLDGACSAAGLALIHVPAKSGYVVDEIRHQIAPFVNTSDLSNQSVESPRGVNRTPSKTCPKCSSAMEVRVAKRGANAGNQFWGCTGYPKCKHVEAMEV